MQTKLRNIISGSLFLSLFLLLVPNQAQGFVLDLAQTQLAALSERTGPVAAFLFSTFVFFGIGYLLLFISTFLLNGIIAITPTALTVTTGDASNLVTAGWNFTAGLVNMVLIIAFIVIAFAVILGSERIQMKKSLPMLIVVALLVNFTLLFVGIGIDISNFLFNTIANQFMSTVGVEGGNLLFQSVKSLFEFGSFQIGVTGAYLAASAIGLLLPYVNVAMQVAWVVGIPWLFTSAIQFIVYGGIMWGLSGVFFLYFLVFLIRIFIIQILAVLAPLAFFCLIFDETKKYWNQWRDALVQWLFVGVIFIFLMYFGLAMAPLIVSTAAPFDSLFPSSDKPILGWWLDSFGPIIGYIALLAYFVVIIGIAKKFVPAAAGAAISQVSGLAKMATPWAGSIAKGAGKRIRNQELERKERIKDIPEPEGRLAKIGHRVTTGKYMSGFVRRAHNIAGTSVEQERLKDVKEKADLFKKKHGEDYEDFAGASNLQLLRTPTDKMAALQYLSEGGAEALTKLKPNQLGDFIELSSKRGDSKTVKNAVKHIPNYGDVATRQKELKEANIGGDPGKIKIAEGNLAAAEKIQRAMMPDIRKINTNVKELEEGLSKAQADLKKAISNNDPVEMINKIKENIAEREKEIGEIGAAAINKISAQSLKIQDIEKLSGDTLKNESFLKAIVENRNIDFMKSIGDRKDGAEVTEKLNEIVNGMDIEGLKKVNITLYNQIRKSPAGQVIFSDMHDKIRAKEKASEKQEETDTKKNKRRR